MKDRHGFCRARDADDFGQVDDVGRDACVPIRVDTDERLVVETASEFKEEPIVTIPAADAEELTPVHFEVKRQAGCCTESIVANLLESFEFEDTFVDLCDRVANASACAQPPETLGAVQGESIVKRF